MEFNGYSVENNKIIERDYVLLTYNKIAKNFSDTRHSVWDYVQIYSMLLCHIRSWMEMGK